ncbi:hypothetical protein [Thermofilum pendens]
MAISMQEGSGGKGLRDRYPNITAVLECLASQKMYGPIDRLSRALSEEAVLAALYDALRAVTTESVRKECAERNIKVTGVPREEVAALLEEVQRGSRVAQKLAIMAITAAPFEEESKAGSAPQAGAQQG